jgi:hypothetical protein
MLRPAPVALAAALSLLLLAPAASARAKPGHQWHERAPATSVAVASPAVEILWGGQWWAGSVLAARAGFRKVHYQGWGAEYDEWVEVARVRLATAAAAPTPSLSPEGLRRVEIRWGGQWWAGVVLETRAGLVKVHYAGWDERWDQWVEPQQLRDQLIVHR